MGNNGFFGLARGLLARLLGLTAASTDHVLPVGFVRTGTSGEGLPAVAQGEWSAAGVDASGNVRVAVQSIGTTTDLDIRDLAYASDSVTAHQGGTWTVTGAGGTFPVTDSGGSLTVDGTVAATQSGSWSVSADTELPAAVTLDDALANPTTPPVAACMMLWNGTNWVRAPGTISGLTIDTELPAATALLDGLANPSAPAVGSYLMLYDASATSWKRARGTPADGLLVDLGSNNDVTLTSGTLTSITNTVTVTGAGGTFPVTDSGGSLTVDDGGSTISIDDGGSTVSIDDGGGTITVDGTVSVTGEVDVLPASPAATAYLPVRLSDGSAFLSALPVTDNSGSLSVDDNGGSLSIDDNGGSLTVDNAALAVTGGGAEASALRVTIASDSTGVLSIDDNGGSLTVDGTVAATQSGTWTVQPGNTANTTAWLVTGTGGTFPVTGTFWQATQPVSIAATVTVDTELPAAGALSDALANPTTPLLGACELLWDSGASNWVRRPSTSEGTLLASASRSADTDSAVQVNHGASGVMIWFRLSVYGGGTGPTIKILAFDPVSGLETELAAYGPRTGTVYPHTIEFAPGVGALATPTSYGTRIEGRLPRHWCVRVDHATATAHTYSVGYTYLP